MSTTRFPNGITTAATGTALAAIGMEDPTKYHVFFDDFTDGFVDTTGKWTETAISVGAGTSAWTGTTDADGGVALCTTAANENDGAALELNSECFLVETGKKMWFKARFYVGDAIQSDMIIGLHSTDTTPLDATMRFAFITADGSAAMFFNSDDNTTDADSSTVVTLADDTYVTVGFYYDGAGNLQLFADDVLITTMTSLGVPGAEMAVGVGYWNGAAGAETTGVDYIFVAKER